jgi:hypothetical protein
MKLVFSFFFFLFQSSFSQQVTFEKHYNFGATENGFAVQQTFDGGYIVAGRHGLSFSVSDLLLMKTDSLGTIIWTKFIANHPYQLFQRK